MKTLVIEPQKRPVVRDIEDHLDTLQEIVGGSIEVLYPFRDGVALVCNEEGKNLGLPLNRLIETRRMRDIICGTFIIAGSRPEDENFSDLTEDQIVGYTRRFRQPQAFVRWDSGLAVIPVEEVDAR